MPLRAAAKGMQATTALVGATMQGAAAATETVGTVASAAFDIATIPVRQGAKILSGEASGSTLTRRCWRGDNRAWIEVRGLNGPAGDERGRAVVDALLTQPGVASASLSRTLSRVVVEIDGEQASLRNLCPVVDDAEKRCRSTDGAATRAGSLPGDGLLLATTGAMVGLNAAGLGIALVGRTLRWPRLPTAVDAAAAIANYQPWLRRQLEDRIGTTATDTVLSTATTIAHIVTLSPASLSVDLMMQALKAAECRAEAQAWARYEPELAKHADHTEVHRPSRPAPAPDGPVERHTKRVAVVQVLGTALVGALTRNVDMAATAAVVTAPKAMRTTRESFAATLGQGLADRHAVLPLRPESLRRLDKVDALLIDPRTLCDDTLRVARVRGARDGELTEAWENAQRLLEQSGLRPGWHPVPGMTTRKSKQNGAVEALILPAQQPLASAVVAEARASGTEMVTVNADILGELRPAFDDIRPVQDGAIDDALADAVADLQQTGRTVAVLSSTGAQALSRADVALGVMPTGEAAPPWGADLILADLAGAWQVLRALPAARAATERGIAISTGASSLGALLMVPGVRGLRRGRGHGPGPVTLGAAAGMLSGYLLARDVVRVPSPRPAPAYEWHAMSVEQVRELLAPADSAAEAQVARGDAQASAAPPNAVWQFVKAVQAELSDPLTPVLALCSAATAMLGSPIDAVMVGTVLTGNSILAAAQRLRAENRLNLLLAQQTPSARKVAVGPDGAQTYSEVNSEHLLPGDLIEVRSNEVVPADARVIDEQDLEVDESSLTGESLSVDKQVEATPGAELADRRCMLYAGTTVVAGTALALVTAVGADTQTRRAAELASGDLPEVGLQHHLSQLVTRAFPVSVGGGALVGALGLLRGGGLRQALGNAIAVAIAAVPEGMPLMATLAQHASAQRLSGSGALVRVPRSVEALGRVEVICFDKTGTLSENRLRVAHVHPVSTYSREDVLHCAAQAAPAPESAAHAHATDQAIVEAAAAANGSGHWSEPDAHLPFRSGRAFSASVSGTELTVKGAPEVVLAACPDVGADMDQTVRDLAAEGLRVIAVARRKLTAQQARAVKADEDTIVALCDDGLTLTGFLGLADTPRPEAPQLLADLTERGVAIRLITGDHPITATAIVAELGLPVTEDQVITGSEWNELSRKDQERAVSERVIFARMTPENKVQIVQTLERAGQVTAMVGDGANDAAAIRAATIGIGVVARGSDAAHTVADVVLTDGRIESLVAAIDEGRRLWRGVQAAVAGLLGGNAGEVIFSVIGTAITGNSPLNTRQLLLMNTLTDALPATALAVSTPSGPVQHVRQGIDERKLWRAVAVRGAITAAAGTAAWTMASVTGTPQRASTVALIALVSAELGQTLVDSQAPLVLLTSAGSLAAFMLMISTPGVSQLLGCTPVGPIGWAQAMGSAAAATAALAVATRLPAGRWGLETPTSHDGADSSASDTVNGRDITDRTQAVLASAVG
ncbi:cation-translocating P-type ATPase [Mycobacterium kyorinense]|uniref:cation-translocating P-type ATPase n=1 Tax=Mycobacterium kyorinense TaxID=487514 RepID=UPI000AF326B2|nr:cation-translocating P-type ATPase [Mycobacterium kyorinense]